MRQQKLQVQQRRLRRQQELVQALVQALELVLPRVLVRELELLLFCRKQPKQRLQPGRPRREICSFHYP